MLYIQKFIQENENWKELIQNPPYNIKIKEDEDFIMFNYTQIADDTDWYSPLVNECRGIILNKKNYEVVCKGFNRFYNYGEPYAAKLDENNKLTITEKIDGSIIKVWTYNGKLHVSTNGAINADKICMQNMDGTRYEDKFFGEVVRELLNAAGYRSPIDGYTDVFELTSPWNKVVLDYKEGPKLWYLCTVQNDTGKDYVEDLVGAFDRPKQYHAENIAAVVNMVSQFENKEGVVVCDCRNNRLKVKTLKYFTYHRVISHFNIEIAIDAVLKNDYEELKTVLPEHLKETVDKIVNIVTEITVDIEKEIELYGHLDRKEYALKRGKNALAPFVFECWYNKRGIQYWKQLKKRARGVVLCRLG